MSLDTLTPTITCDCPRSTHTHGTVRMHRVHKCQCDACLTATFRAGKAYRAKKARGINVPRYSQAAPVRAHIEAILAAGVNPRYISHRSGLADSTVRHVRYGKGEHVTSRVGNLILAVPIPTTQQFNKSRVLVHGTRLRLQALVSIGYTSKNLAALMGMDFSAVQRIVDPDYYHANVWVSTKVRDKVARLYDNYWDKPATATNVDEQRAITNALNRATRKGWVPPLALDEDRIDDPTYFPDPKHNARSTR